jgi:hypothetical protein
MEDDRTCTRASFCDYSAGICHLVVNNRISVGIYSRIDNLLSMEVVDTLVSNSSIISHASFAFRRAFPHLMLAFHVHPWPTIDLVIPSDWTGTLELNNPPPSSEELEEPEPAPFIFLPFDALSIHNNNLNVIADSKVSVPKLKLRGFSPNSPIYFLASRGGKFKDITVDAEAGLFVGRAFTFAKSSTVSVRLPRGDVLLNTVNPVSTDILSLYSATAPVVLSVNVQLLNSSNFFIIEVLCLNVRSTVPDFGDVYLSFEPKTDSSPAIPNCLVKTPSPGIFDSRGVITAVSVPFQCNTRFLKASEQLNPFSYNIVLSYFGDSIPLNYEFRVNVDITNSVATLSNAFILSTNNSVLPTPSALPNNLCAVGAQAASSQNTLTSSGFTPLNYFVNRYLENNNFPISMSFSSSSNPNFPVKFICREARSISLSSFQHSFGDEPDETLLGSNPHLIFLNPFSCNILNAKPEYFNRNISHDVSAFDAI